MMIKSDIPGLSPLWLIMLALVLGVLIVVMIPVSIAGGDAIRSSDWMGFAGNVVSGAMTLLAAAIAWFAVQRQITAQKEIAKLEETEAWEIIRGDLQEIVYRIDVFWKSVDHAIEPAKNDTIRDWRHSNVMEYFHELPDAIEIEELEKGASSLGVQKRRRLSVLIFVVRELRRKVEHFATGPKQPGHDLVKWRGGRIGVLRTMLTIFDQELRRLDPDLAAAFEGRVRAEIGSLTRKEQLEMSWRDNLEYELTLE
jgi:hypothetical protein